MTTIREERLLNGLRLTFIDETNRYFGDYHRVCLRVVISVDLGVAASFAEDVDFWTTAQDILGGDFSIEKKLVRMGVPGAEVDATVASLADEFLKAANDYMARPDYPKRLAQTELDKRKKILRF